VSRLKQKAVKMHEDFKEATKTLREHRLGAKKGRMLLKRHYVALIEDAGGVEDPGTCRTHHTHAHTPHTPHTHAHMHTHPLIHAYAFPSPLPAKKKLVELKTLFWSRPDVYNKYMDHELPSSDDEDGDDEDVTAADVTAADVTAADNEDVTAAEDEDGETTDEHQWVPSDESDDGNDDSNGSNDDDSNGSNGSNDDDDGNSDDDDEVSQADSDCYYRYAVNDGIDAYWGGGPLTVPCWMDAVIVALDPESDLYEVRWTFNGEKVSWVGRGWGEGNHKCVHP